jgi:hypothetical protein
LTVTLKPVKSSIKFLSILRTSSSVSFILQFPLFPLSLPLGQFPAGSKCG